MQMFSIVFPFSTHPHTHTRTPTHPLTHLHPHTLTLTPHPHTLTPTHTHTTHPHPTGHEEDVPQVPPGSRWPLRVQHALARRSSCLHRRWPISGALPSPRPWVPVQRLCQCLEVLWQCGQMSVSTGTVQLCDWIEYPWGLRGSLPHSGAVEPHVHCLCTTFPHSSIPFNGTSLIVSMNLVYTVSQFDCCCSCARPHTHTHNIPAPMHTHT